MNGIKEVAPELDLKPIKCWYAEKWASGPNKTLGHQSLVDQYMRDLDSEAEEEREDDEDGLSQKGDVVGTTQEGDRMEHPASGVTFSQEVGAVDYQELDLLAS